MAKRLSWAVRIERAEKRGKFTKREHELAQYSWNTCAVGEKNNWPTAAAFEPDIGTEEFELGAAFGDEVALDNIPEARRLYAEIMALP